MSAESLRGASEITTQTLASVLLQTITHNQRYVLITNPPEEKLHPRNFIPLVLVFSVLLHFYNPVDNDKSLEAFSFLKASRTLFSKY